MNKAEGTNKSIMVASLLLSIGMCISSLIAFEAVKNFHRYDKYVDVKGLDERVVKSDLASWQISFATSANGLDEIYQKISDSQQIVYQFLLNAGFKETEIERQPISVTDNYADAYAQRNKDVLRFKATTGITLVTNKIDLVAATSQKTSSLIQKGILLTSNSVKYAFTDLNSVKSDMLDKATQNAYDAAQSFAKNAKAHLGSIRRAQQGLFTITPAGVNAEYDDSSIMKKVRIVTTVQYFLD